MWSPEICEHHLELLTSNFILKKTGLMDEYLVWVFYIVMIFLFTHLRKEILLIEQRLRRAKREQRPRRPAADTRRADGDVEYENIRGNEFKGNSETKGQMDGFMGWFRYFLFSIWACSIAMIFLLMHLQQKIILIKQRGRQHELLSSSFKLKKTGQMDGFMGWFRYFLFSIWACSIAMIFLLMHLQQKIILIKQRCERAQRTQRAATSTEREDGDVFPRRRSEDLSLL
ncbi:hypothetical protein AOLI_G00219730 [Acnodon oligacanthus]